MTNKNSQATSRQPGVGKTSPPHTKKMHRGRGGGAPLGNKNNLQHGFYSETFTDEEKILLQQKLKPDEDLNALRIKALRLARLTPLRTIAKKELMALDRFFKAMQEINTIQRTQILSRGHGGALGRTIVETLDGMNPDDIDT